jgi:VIT1/CCC1 family predicted Fe2+/Mn2+ transporter
MAEDEPESSKRVLDPVERSSEVLFGLIMVLTFTSSLSAAQYGHAEVRSMIIGALGCNLAWGIIDAMMYLMAALSEKGHGLATFRAVRSAPTIEDAYNVIRGALPPLVGDHIEPAQLEDIRQKLLALTEPSDHVRLRRQDWLGALGVFLLVFLTTFPVVAPFLLVHDARTALHVSNLVAILMLAVAGYSYGRYSGQKPWLWSLSMIILGLAMVALTVRLGG